MQNNNNSSLLKISEWVEKANHTPHLYLERQATEILLHSIGKNSPFEGKLYLKGGILMGVVYQSPRQTADIDFTADIDPNEKLIKELGKNLNLIMRKTAVRLGYPDLICKLQSTKKRPKPTMFETASFPAIELKIAYAVLETNNYTKLENGECPNVLKVEISFNEPVEAIEFIGTETKSMIATYGLTELIAEKLRALLQQVDRKRNRRQDIYDINHLIKEMRLTPMDKQKILERLLSKASSRKIKAHQNSLSNNEIKNRAGYEWNTLQLELEELPDFELTYKAVEKFYRSLPWEPNS